MVTPVNPKVPSTGEPPEPDLGMLPPGLRRTTGGGSKPALNPGQRTGSLKAIQEELRKTLARKKAEERAAQAAKAAKVAKKSGVKAPKGGVKKLHRFQTWNCCFKGDQEIPEIHRTFDPKATLSTTGTGNCR